MKRVGVYVRVSTLDQSPEMQRRELVEYVRSRGWQLVEVYEDKATGKTDKREMLQKCLKDARERRFDVLACWKLDRVFRSFHQMIATLQLLGELGVEFVSLKDPGIDMTTSTGRLMTHLIAAFAEFEADIIRTRVRAGLANAKAKGKTLGRPAKLSGSRVAELRSQGLSLSQIAAKVGATKSAVSKSLKKSRAQVAEKTRARKTEVAGE